MMDEPTRLGDILEGWWQELVAQHGPPPTLWDDEDDGTAG